jgi:hypothetical protein
MYHRTENPCHVLRDRPELKETRTAIATGTMAQAKNSQETKARKRGLRHGFEIHPRSTDTEFPR